MPRRGRPAVTGATTPTAPADQSGDRGAEPYLAQTIDTPDGPFTIIATDAGIVASGWTAEVEFLLGRLHHLVWSPRTAPMRVDQRRVAWRVVNQAWAAIDAYYQGNGTAAQQVPILQPVGPFHERVRRSLRATRYGEHLTYTELAAAAGNSAAARAAAAACAHNNIALFVPCHRVIRTNGTLGGFLYGLPLKQRLLNREGLPTRSGSSRPPATQAAL